MSTQSVGKAKSMETKLKIFADFEAGKRAGIGNVEADRCYREVLTEPRIEPAYRFFFQEHGRSTVLNFCILTVFSRLIQVLNIFLKFNSTHISVGLCKMYLG
jgi:hypothetical protein